VARSSPIGVIATFNAGAIDAPKYYGSIYSDRFKQRFPRGLDPIYEAAKAFGCRLGVWLGPDGFGNTPEEQKARTDMLVKLCRDYNFRLFKVDAVCGQLRTEKQDAFIDMLKQCRKYCPDLIVINHRLNLGHALPYVTTKLWGGRFTGGTDPLVETFTWSLPHDLVFLRHDVAGSIAHAKMLGKCRIIPAADSRKLVRGLTRILRQAERGTLPTDWTAEDVHTMVQAALERRVGAVARKLHTARSRNDQVALDLRLWLRETLDLTIADVRTLQRALVACGERVLGSNALLEIASVAQAGQRVSGGGLP